MKNDNKENIIIDQCIKDAFDLTNEISAADYRLETFKIVLSQLLERRLNEGTQGKHTQTSVSTEPTKQKSEDNSGLEELPTIIPADSTRNNIVLLLETGWGSKPRTSAEINKALDYNGVGDSKNVSTRLKELFEDRIILRRNQGDAIVYWKNPNPPPSKK